MSAPLDTIADLRARLAKAEGPKLWRSLDALAETPEFRSFLEAEFPAALRFAPDPERRRFLRLMTASFAMAGLAACSPPSGHDEEAPYVRNPERIEPGAFLSYASSALLDGVANGILVRTTNGRPLKIEGNPDHPWSRGGADAFGQASILDLYDPERSQTVLYLTRPSDWLTFEAAMAAEFSTLRAAQGRGLRLLTGPLTSPSLLAQIDRMRRDFPQMHWHVHEPISRAAAYEAANRAFGQRLETQWTFEQARVVVSIGGDFLGPGPRQVGVSRAFADARRSAAKQGLLLELFSAASTPTLTSAKSDQHIALDPSELAALLGALQAESDNPSSKGSDPRALWIRDAGAALRAARGASIVIAGDDQPVAIQEAAHRLNAALGNLGKTVTFTQPLSPEAETLDSLVDAMRAGQVATLVTIGANPVYAAPASLGFVDALDRVKLKIHAGLRADETAAYADWHAPLAHPLESWGDARSPDGTASLLQPMIAPLYDGRSASEIVSILVDSEPRSGLDVLSSYWRGDQSPQAFAPKWRQALIDGFMRNTAFPAKTAQVAAPASPAAPAAASPRSSGLTALFRPDPTVWDGSIADNGWLQELPKPLTKIVWENCIAVSPALAERERLSQGDRVRITLADRAVEGPIWILPGQAAQTITLYLGYGRRVPDTVSFGLGYDAFAVQTRDGALQADGVRLVRAQGATTFATTQDHSTMEGHDFVRVMPVGAPAPREPGQHKVASLYPPAKGWDDRSWGMVIDDDACIGCNACVVACQAENNIPIVGRDQVALGREMHWLRIDRYYSNLKGGEGLDDPDTHFQPVPCMQCEDAPCEVACPVEATLHDHEGLNLMIYNRCVGTRACSSYCPYKVRHFNYLDYTAVAPALQLQRNPEVTVRARGVMEKCTYCIQRIAEARIISDKTETPIPDGSVKTACQSACPTQAIVFGDLKDSKSAVRAARADPRNYTLLAELDTKPHTTYLAERGLPTSGAAAAPAGKVHDD